MAAPVALASIIALTLLLVGGADHDAVELKQQASRLLRCGQRFGALTPFKTHDLI